MRFGRNKALETLDHQTLIHRTVSSLSILGTEIVVVTGPHNTELGLDTVERVRIVLDAWPGRGPLVGIYSGLLNSRSEMNLAVACDMPFLNLGLLRYMAAASSGYDAVVPRLGKGIEPLHSIYSCRCLPKIRAMLDEGVYSVSELLRRVSVRYIEADEIDRFDPERLSFFNINTEADMKRARELVRQGAENKLATGPATWSPGFEVRMKGFPI